MLTNSDANCSRAVLFGFLETANSIFCLTKQVSCLQLYTSDCIIVLYSGVSTQNCVIVSCTIVVFCCTYDSPESYTATYNFQQDDATMLADCQAQNADSECSAQVCSCELKFISNYIDLQWSNAVYTGANKHENGFDQEVTCPKVGISGVNSKSCCGEYPSRTPYGGKLECCNESGHIFNPLVSECCGVSGTAAIGAC